jgi:NADH-quinone oxidoreductase subunit M
MGAYVEGQLLSWIIFLPLLAGGVLLASGSALRLVTGGDGLPAVIWRVAGIGASGLTFVLAAGGMLLDFDPEQIGFQLVERVSWLPELGVHYFVGVDGINLFPVLLTTLIVPLVLLASWHQIDRSLRGFVFCVLALETGVLGVLLSLNLAAFYLFWEMLLLLMYFLIGIWGGSRRIFAATKLLLFSLFGSLPLLAAMLVLYRLNFDQGGAWNLDLVTLPGAKGFALLDTAVPLVGGSVPWWQTQTALFAALALGFSIKLPVFPFHTWLPDAHVEAPSAASVLLASLLLGLGAYGLLRFALPLFPNAAADLGPTFLALGLASILICSMLAMVQRDVKRLVAYASVVQLGFVLIGIFSLNVHGLTGAVVQLVNHGLTAGALLLLIGVMIERRQTRDIGAFGGLAKPMPVFGAIFGIVVMSSIGLPTLNGFVGNLLVLLGSFEAHRWVAVGACAGLALAAVYMLSLLRRVVLGPVENPENRGLIDLGWRERLVFLALLIPIFWIGLHPNPMLRRIEPSVLELLRQMDERRVVESTPPAPAKRPLPGVEGGEAI